MSNIIIQNQMTIVGNPQFKNKQNKLFKNQNMYDALYDSLKDLEKVPHGIPKYRFAFTKNVQNMAIQNKLIVEATVSESLLGRTYNKRGIKYYKMAEKGMEYIRVYEKLQDLVTLQDG